MEMYGGYKKMIEKKIKEESIYHNFKIHEKPLITVNMLIFTIKNEIQNNYRKLPGKTLQILLIKRKKPPYKEMWSLPGGFVKFKENLNEAAKRELKEKTNIDNVYMEQLYTWGDVNRDSRGRIISTSYFALVDSSLLSTKADDDAKEIRWFKINNKLLNEKFLISKDGYNLERLFKLLVINNEICLSADICVKKQVYKKLIKTERQLLKVDNMAFDHAKIIHYCLERLKNKVEYTNIAFNLMPEYFSLTELQKVYEAILGKALTAANFRRKISNKVIMTNQYNAYAGHRPSKLYKFNSHWANEKM